jgi:peptidoglycan/LPS O-acetylase OafA/YrhL
MLSGFVLSFAYQERLDRWAPGEEWSTSTFMKVRLIRIYPIYFLGIITSSFFLLLQSLYGRESIAVPTLASFVALGLLLLPVPPGVGAGGAMMFPCDVPAWALFFEVLANLFHGALLRRRGWQFITLAAVLWAAILQYGVTARNSLNIGAYRTDLLFGCARILFAYTMGLLVFRLRKAHRDTIPRVSPFLLFALFVALISTPKLTSGFAPRYGLLTISTMLPLIILLAANSPMPTFFVRPAAILGASSYAVYLLHVPIAEIFEQAWKMLRHHSIEVDAPWGGILDVALTLLLAILVGRFYDEPLRNGINRRLSGRSRGHSLISRPADIPVVETVAAGARIST